MRKKKRRKIVKAMFHEFLSGGKRKEKSPPVSQLKKP